LQYDAREPYIGPCLVAGGVTPSSSEENISEGMLIWLAAVIADGDVSAAAKVIIASGKELFSHPRNDLHLGRNRTVAPGLVGSVKFIVCQPIGKFWADRLKTSRQKRQENSPVPIIVVLQGLTFFFAKPISVFAHDASLKKCQGQTYIPSLPLDF